MSAVALAPPGELRLWDERPREPRSAERERPSAPVGVDEPVAALAVARARVSGGASLDDVVAGSWEALVSGAAAACPSCGGVLRARWSAGAGVVGGHCDGCGADLR